MAESYVNGEHTRQALHSSSTRRLERHSLAVLAVASCRNVSVSAAAYGVVNVGTLLSINLLIPKVHLHNIYNFISYHTEDTQCLIVTAL